MNEERKKAQERYKEFLEAKRLRVEDASSKIMKAFELPSPSKTFCIWEMNEHLQFQLVEQEHNQKWFVGSYLQGKSFAYSEHNEDPVEAFSQCLQRTRKKMMEIVSSIPQQKEHTENCDWHYDWHRCNCGMFDKGEQNE